MIDLNPPAERMPAFWPRTLPQAPNDLLELISNALADFGPDGNCDGAERIAAIVAAWSSDMLALPPPDPIYLEPDADFSADDVRRMGNVASDDWTRADEITHWRYHVDDRTRRLWLHFAPDQKVAIAKACYRSVRTVMGDRSARQ